MSRFDHIQVAFSRLLSAIYYGESKWMLSSEAYKRKDSGVCGMIDSVFSIMFRETDHCKKSYEWESQVNES